MPGSGASARRAGHTFERDVARFLNTVTTRSQRPGVWEDMGDIALDGWVVECRNRQAASHLVVMAWLADVEQKAARVGHHAALVLKNRNRPIALARVVMRPVVFAELMGVSYTRLLDDPINKRNTVETDLATFRAYYNVAATRGMT